MFESTEEVIDTCASLDDTTTDVMTGPILSELKQLDAIDDIRNLAGDILNCIRSSSPSVRSTDSGHQNRDGKDYFVTDTIQRSASPSMRSAGGGNLNLCQDFSHLNQRGTVVGITRTDGASALSAHENGRRPLLERRHSDPHLQTLGMTLRSSSKALLECGSANGSLANSVDVRSILDDIGKPVNDIDAANALLAVAGNLEFIKDHLSFCDDDDLDSLDDDKPYDDDNKSFMSRRSASSKRSDGSKRSYGSVGSRRSVGSCKSIGSKLSYSRRITPKANKVGPMIPNIPKPHKARTGALSIPKAPAYPPKPERLPTTIQIEKLSSGNSKTDDMFVLDVDDDDTLDPDDDDRILTPVEMTDDETDFKQDKGKQSDNNIGENPGAGQLPTEATPTDMSLTADDGQANYVGHDEGSKLSQRGVNLTKPSFSKHPSHPGAFVVGQDHELNNKGENQHDDRQEKTSEFSDKSSSIKDRRRTDTRLAYVDYQVTLLDSDNENHDDTNGDGDFNDDEKVAVLTSKAEPIEESYRLMSLRGSQNKTPSSGLPHITARHQHHFTNDEDDEVAALTPEVTQNEESNHSAIFLGKPNRTTLSQRRHSVTSLGNRLKSRSPVNLNGTSRLSDMAQEGMNGPTMHYIERKRYAKESEIKPLPEALAYRRAPNRTASSVREPQDIRVLGQQSKVKSGVQREQRRSQQPYPYSSQDSSLASAQGISGPTLPNQLPRSDQSRLQEDQPLNKVRQTRGSSIGYFPHSITDDYSHHMSKDLEHQISKRPAMPESSTRFTGHGLHSNERGNTHQTSQRHQNNFNNIQLSSAQHTSEEVENSMRSTRSRDSLRSADTGMSSRGHGETRYRDLRQTRPMNSDGKYHQRARQTGSNGGFNLGTGKSESRHDIYHQQMAQTSDSRRAMKRVAQQQDEQLRLLDLKRGMRPMLAELKQRSRSRLNVDDEVATFRMDPLSSTDTLTYCGTPPENAKHKNGIPMVISFDVRQSGRSVSPYCMKDDKEMDLNEMTVKLMNYGHIDPGLTGFPVGPQLLNSTSFHQHTQPLSRDDKLSISAHDTNLMRDANRRRPNPQVTSRQYGR